MRFPYRTPLTLVAVAAWLPLAAQNFQPLTISNRVVAPVDETQRVSLPGNVPLLAQARFDLGPAPASLPTGRVLMVLQRSRQQQQALTQYLADLQNPAAPAYHRWLTPEQYGARFGPGDADLATVESWLQGQGFRIEEVPRGRNVIAFSGSMAQLQSAFHIAMHAFGVNGQMHYANVSDPQIPAALAPVVAGVTPLSDLHPQPDIRLGTRGRYDPVTHAIEPDLTILSSGTGAPSLFVNPADAATIYDTPNAALNPNYTGSTTYDGTGVNIGILGTSDLTLADVANYRMAFLGETAATVHLPTVVVDGNDPGLTNGADEALLDTEIAGGLAPEAKIYFYTAADTGVSSGLMNAWFRALDDNTVSILNISFSGCEAALGAGGNQAILEAAEQAAAQGISVTVSAGDAGSAGCDDFDTESLAQYGLAVNGLASTPWTIAVGGTDFDALPSNFSTYASTGLGNAPYYRTANGYIPEEPWNNSTEPNAATAANAAYRNASGGTDIVAGGGGASIVYTKPAFQSSLTPGDAARDLPDVSLFAADGFYHAWWAFCSDSATDGNSNETYTECQTTGGQLTAASIFGGAGGTSTAAPAFAGMLALVEQQTGSRLGQADSILYALALSQYAAVFHDATSGDNSVPCSGGSANCAANGFLTGYNAGAGYDLASGLGSVDAAALVNRWSSVALAPTSSSLTIDGSTAPLSVVHGKPLTFAVGVSPAAATGVVGIIDTANESASGPQNDGQFSIALSGGGGSASYSGLPGGTYAVSAYYGGDTAHAASFSAPIQVTVAPEASATTVEIEAANPLTGAAVANLAAIPYGSRVALDALITGAAEGSNTQGLATGAVTWTDGAATLGTASVGAGNVAAYPGPGAAVFAAGAHSVMAKYSGDASYDPSASSPVGFSIVPAVTAISAATNGTISAGQNADVSFAVTTPANLGALPGGTVQLSLNGQPLGAVANLQSATVGSGAAASFQISGTATIPANQLAPGATNVIILSYSGDGNYSAASTTLSVVVTTAAAGFSLENSGNISAAPGSNGSSTLTLMPAGGFTGAVVFACTVSGNPPINCITQMATVTGAGPVNSTVTAEVASSAPPGSYTATITAQDASTGTLAASTTLTITVMGGTPAIVLSNSGSLTITPGATSGNTAIITVSGSNGFSGPVNLSCSVATSLSRPTDPPACELPSSVTIGSGPAATATLTIATTAPSNAAVVVFFAGGGATLAMLFFPGVPARRRAWRSVLGGLAAVCGIFLAGAGIGCGSTAQPSTQSGSGSANSGTTAGAYVVTITAADAATGRIQATTTVTVTVE